MKRRITIVTLISSALLLVACEEPEVEKAARRENKGAAALKSELNVVEPKGNNPRY